MSSKGVGRRPHPRAVSARSAKTAGRPANKTDSPKRSRKSAKEAFKPGREAPVVGLSALGAAEDPHSPKTANTFAEGASQQRLFELGTVKSSELSPEPSPIGPELKSFEFRLQFAVTRPFIDQRYKDKLFAYRGAFQLDPSFPPRLVDLEIRFRGDRETVGRLVDRNGEPVDQRVRPNDVLMGAIGLNVSPYGKLRLLLNYKESVESDSLRQVSVDGSAEIARLANRLPGLDGWLRNWMAAVTRILDGLE